MRKFSLIILSFFICFQFVLADKTTFKAYFPGAANHGIQCYFNTDYISNYSEMKLDEVIDENGYFIADFDLTQTTYVSFEIDFYSSGFYLEPDKVYNVKTDSLFTIDEFRPFYSKKPLLIEFVEPDTNDLNYIISELNWEVDKFLEEHFNEIYIYRKNNLVDTLKTRMEKKFADINNDFFKSYLQYKIANIYFAGKSVNKYELFKNNIKDKEILYFHPEYMQYFNTYFDHYLLSGSRQISRYDLVIAVNYDQTYAALMDTLGKDSLLLNDRLRELVMLKGLKEVYSDIDFSQTDIERIISEVVEKSPFHEHRIIAKNLLFQLTSLNKGSFAPEFSLHDIVNDSITTIRDFKGTPVFLNFMTMKSYSCQAEMKIIHDLNEKFSDSILFVTLCYFDDPRIWKKFADENHYTWKFLWASNDAQLRNNYKLRTLPVFVLINRDGRIEEYPARKPSENIEYVLHKMILK